MIESRYLFYLLIFVLSVGVLQALTVGALFFFRRAGGKLANQFFGLLLITFGLTLLHNVFNMTGFYDRYPSLYFAPIYFTLAFPTLLFYYVKLSLYPAYKLRWTDAKHFLLPFGQIIFFLVLFIFPVEFKSQFGRHFYNPFYGAFEQFLYLSTFFAYMYFAFRYIRQKRRHIKDRIEGKKVLYLKYLVQILFILFFIHSVFVVWDFFSYEFLNINFAYRPALCCIGSFVFCCIAILVGNIRCASIIMGKAII